MHGFSVNNIFFFHFFKVSANDIVLLIVDGHYSNTKNLNVEAKARENSVAIVSLPPHSKHKIQPLDVGFLKSLKILGIRN